MGGEDGISIVMINVDMDGATDVYLPCLTYYDQGQQGQNNRIFDTNTTYLNSEVERPKVINGIKIKLCETEPSPQPTRGPTSGPTPGPTDPPTKNPTRSPTKPPTKNPTLPPTPSPTGNPTPSPTGDPTPGPTDPPTKNPTRSPTKPPTKDPTLPPTPSPTDNPTPPPTGNPTPSPTPSPTPPPTKIPTCPNNSGGYGYGYSDNECNGYSKECCPKECEWNDSYQCAEGGPKCCDKKKTPRPTTDP